LKKIVGELSYQVLLHKYSTYQASQEKEEEEEGGHFKKP